MPVSIERVGILHNTFTARAEPLALEISEWLADREVSVWHSSDWDERWLRPRLNELSLLLVLGGDGSTLHAARLSVPFKVPLLGINLGRVGFLSEARPENWPEKLTKVLAGDYWIEKRMLIEARLQRQGTEVQNFSALNDIVVGRGKQARVLRLHLQVDDDLVTTYTADGLIVATPTGSTAYSMAAGGPLLPPQLQNLVVVPVAAHLSLDRALVLHEEARIVIQVEMEHEATLTADGQRGIDLADGDRILVQKHAEQSYFARVESSGYFYRRLMRRLGFGLPPVAAEWEAAALSIDDD